MYVKHLPPPPPRLNRHNFNNIISLLIFFLGEKAQNEGGMTLTPLRQSCEKIDPDANPEVFDSNQIIIWCDPLRNSKLKILKILEIDVV